MGNLQSDSGFAQEKYAGNAVRSQGKVHHDLFPVEERRFVSFFRILA
jgi:hypothetical protein